MKITPQQEALVGTQIKRIGRAFRKEVRQLDPELQDMARAAIAAAIAGAAIHDAIEPEKVIGLLQTIIDSANLLIVPAKSPAAPAPQ